MDFELTKTQTELKNSVIDFSHNVLKMNGNEEFSMENWEKLSNFGILGICVDKKYGGQARSYLDAAVAIEALGYGCKNNGFILAMNNHIWVGLNLIARHGSEFLKDKYLKDMVLGKHICALGMAETGAGSDALSMATTYTENGENFVLNGEKFFVSNGTVADVFLIFALSKEEPHTLSMFIVDRDFEGVSVGEDIEKMGLSGCPTAVVSLNNVRVPKENLLGSKEIGSIILSDTLGWERVYEFAAHIGAMQRIMETCLEYATGRKQFGKSLSEFQGVSHKISNMKIAIELSRNYLYKVATLKDEGKNAYLEASIFKTFLSERYVEVSRDAVQIFGAYGYEKKSGIEKELRDAIASTIYSGTNEMQRNTIFQLLGIDKYYDA